MSVTFWWQLALSRIPSNLRTSLCKRQNQFRILGSMEVINAYIPSKVLKDVQIYTCTPSHTYGTSEAKSGKGKDDILSADC